MMSCLVIPLPGGNSLHVCVCACLCPDYEPRCILGICALSPLLCTPHTNDRPTSVPYLKLADDATLTLVRDGSASCHCRVQTNKLELNLLKTIEIQVSHFHRHLTTHPLLDIMGSRVAQLLERQHSNRTCFPAPCSSSCEVRGRGTIC